MPILNIDMGVTGQAGLVPQEIYIETSDTLAEVTAAGYLNKAKQNGYAFANNQIAHVYGIDFNNGEPGCLDFQVGISPSGVVTLSGASEGGVELPVIANHIAVFKNTDGTIGDDAATAINGGNIQAGLSGTAGHVASFPAIAARGSLRLSAVANSGDTVVVISNSSMAQATTVSIPDPGEATANFLLDTGAASALTYQKMISLSDLLLANAGTWTMTRVAQGDYALVHTAADDTTILSFDITPMLQSAASKGFKLNSLDVIYSVGTLALDAHSLTLDSVVYANNAANVITSVPLTGALATATQANPYVTNLAVTTPAYLNTADAKYVIELTVNAAATSDYSLYGINLRFNQTIA